MEADSPAGLVHATYKIDLTAYEGMWIGQASLSKLISSVDKISKGLTQLHSGLSNKPDTGKIIELQTAETTAIEDDWVSHAFVEAPSSRSDNTEEEHRVN